MRLPAESVIETILAQNLGLAFGANLIRRQQPLGDEAADIFGTMPDGAPVLVEIKVTEDRHVLGQILRYRHRLLQLKPLSERVDYTKPVRLLIVAPTISEQTLIELAACTLPVELWVIELRARGAGVGLRLKRVDLPDQPPVDVPTTLSPTPEEPLAPIPARLETWLSSVSVPHGNGIRRFREVLVSAGEKEIIEPTRFLYGARKTNLVAEIRFERKRNRPVVFAWLGKFPFRPVPTTESLLKTPVLRTRIWSDDDATVTHLHHVAEDFGRMKTPREWMEDAAAEVDKLPSTTPEYKKSMILQHARAKATSGSSSHHSTTPLEIENYLWCHWEGYRSHRAPKSLPLLCRTEEKPDFWVVLARWALLLAYRKRGSSASNRLG